MQPLRSELSANYDVQARPNIANKTRIVLDTRNYNHACPATRTSLGQVYALIWGRNKFPKELVVNFRDFMMSSLLAASDIELEVTKSVYQNIATKKQADLRFDKGFIEAKYNKTSFSFEINKTNLETLRDNLGNDIQKLKELNVDEISRRSSNEEIRHLAYNVYINLEALQDPQQSRFTNAYAGEIPVELRSMAGAKISKTETLVALQRRYDFLDSILKEGDSKIQEITSTDPKHPIAIYYKERDRLTQKMQHLREQHPEYADIFDMIKVPSGISIEEGKPINSSTLPSQKYMQRLVQSIQEAIPRNRLDELKEAGLNFHVGKTMSDADLQARSIDKGSYMAIKNEFFGRNTLDSHTAHSKGLDGIYLSENATGFLNWLNRLFGGSSSKETVREELAHSYEALLSTPNNRASQSSGFRTALLLDIAKQDSFDRDVNGYEIQLGNRGRFDSGAAEAFARPIQAKFEAEKGEGNSFIYYQEDFPRVIAWVNQRLTEHDNGISLDNGQHNHPERISEDINSLTTLLKTERAKLEIVESSYRKESKKVFQRNFVQEIEDTLERRREDLAAAA